MFSGLRRAYGPGSRRGDKCSYYLHGFLEMLRKEGRKSTFLTLKACGP